VYFTNKMDCYDKDKGYRFSYSDKKEPCYSGNVHKNNGFCVFLNKNGLI
jgi:hypothetical protein